ncbi:hypothetical protein BDZ94DRAFT_496392 [Collybia nuda]|uniref:DUF6534 domain-containing protein n=1 Tax=Collybia nuda TaxID=64659 RepID=A0A9P5Y990_9AGAR|nr:hypothetical protein BDZ94DRAFT_496392 [Collybia nuda]
MDGTLSGEPVVEIPGAILLGAILQSFLLGVVMVQVIVYWANYQDDSRRKHIFIFAVVIISILQTVLEGYKSWRTIVHQKLWSTSAIQWGDLFLNGLLSSMCECFFIRRCWKVLYSLSTLSCTIAIANLYLAVAMGIALHTFGSGVTEASLYSSKHILVSTVVAFSFWIFGSFVLDVIVTSILVITLWRSKTGLRDLDQVVTYIIVITLESAALPAICMLVAVGLYHASPHLKDHLILFFLLLTGKLYVVGMLRTLNSRVKLRQRMKSYDRGRTSVGAFQWDRAGSSEMPGDQGTHDLSHSIQLA